MKNNVKMHQYGAFSYFSLLGVDEFALAIITQFTGSRNALFFLSTLIGTFFFPSLACFGTYRVPNLPFYFIFGPKQALRG